MLKNAPVVILDEATSFADPENEDKIQEALSRLIAGKTVVIVAHRLSTVVDADNIVLLENGEIADQGKHTELLTRSPLYKKLWDAHIESMEWDIGGERMRRNGTRLSGNCGNWNGSIRRKPINTLPPTESPPCCWRSWGRNRDAGRGTRLGRPHLRSGSGIGNGYQT
jgi:ABC-type glutathione transport system ATPase component